MTPKELMYIEDCLGMENQLKIKCNDYAQKVKDPQLSQFLQELSQKHSNHFNMIYNQLN